MLPTTHALVPLDHPSQIGRIRRDAMALAQGIGLKAEDTERVGIVATEMATNITKFGGPEGAMLVHADRAAGIELLGLDRGPGLPEGSLTDRTSTAGTMGTGLGAIRRLSDVFDVYTRDGGGTVLLARVEARRAGVRPRTGRAAGLSVAAGDLPECGDAWFVLERDRRTQYGVLDGLGHGAPAAVVVRRAAGVLDNPGNGGPEAVLRRLQDGLAGSRGAVALVAEVVGEALHHVGIGNIAGRVLSADGASRLISHPGIVGQGTPTVRTIVTPFPAGGLLVLHSDGISQKWRLADYPGLESHHPSVIAGVLFRDHANRRDDATVLVVRP